MFSSNEDLNKILFYLFWNLDKSSDIKSSRTFRNDHKANKKRFFFQKIPWAKFHCVNRVVLDTRLTLNTSISPEIEQMCEWMA